MVRLVSSEIALVLFIVLQLLDGVLTYLAITSQGISMEGNPLIALLMDLCGVYPAIIVSKGVLILAGLFLYRYSPKWVSILVVCVLILAVIPWTLFFLANGKVLIG